MVWGEAGVIFFQNQGSSEADGRIDRSPEVPLGLSMISTHPIQGCSLTTAVGN